MKGKKLVLTAVGASLCATTVLSAGFTGLVLERDFVGDGWLENGYGATGLTTYRLYAAFDGQGDDGMLAIYGAPQGREMVITSSDGTFHNDPLGTERAPLDLTPAIWANQWDTYVTIGATTAVGDATSLSPGFRETTNGLGSNWSSDNHGWFVTPIDDQSRADENNRVLLAQFVVQAGAEVTGLIDVLTRENKTYVRVAFPGPGSLALLALAGVSRSRRRHTPSRADSPRIASMHT